MKKNKFHMITILLGVILALAVIVTHIFQFQDFRSSFKEKTKVEHQQQTNDTESFVSAPSSTLPSTANFQLAAAVYCLFELPAEKEEEPIDRPVSVRVSYKFFQTLFQLIISPNAP